MRLNTSVSTLYSNPNGGIMNKKFFTILAFGGLLSSPPACGKNVYVSLPILKQCQNVLRDKTYNLIEFAWDMHDVLVKVDKWATAFSKNCMAGLRFKFKSQFNPEEYQKLAQEIPNFPDWAKNPVETFDKLKTEHQTAEHIWVYLNAYADILMQYKEQLCPCRQSTCKTRKAEKIAKGFYQRAQDLRNLASCAQKPIKGMAEIVAQIDGLGCVQRPLSNIGTLFYQDLLNVQNTYDSILRYFKDGSTVTYQAFKQPLMKPNRTFFTAHQNKFNPTKNKVLIFIDDKIENVLAAREAGYVAILYTGAKDLRISLQSIGFPIA